MSVTADLRFDELQHADRFARYPQRGHPIALSDIQYETRDGRMKVPMFVAIDVVELQSGNKKSLELRRNFIRDLPARHRIDKYPHAGSPHIAAKPADGVGGGRSPDHEAGRRQDAVLVSGLNRRVDFGRKTKIVGRHDQRLQCATPRRSRRK